MRCVLRESQSNEDIILLPLLLESAGGRPGAFVEIGAYTGHEMSQTWLLEKCFNWTGVLIEASPQNFAKLSLCNRSSVKVHSAVCNATGHIMVAGGGGTVAGVVEDFPRSFAKKWAGVHNRYCGGMACNARVPCRPLDSIIVDSGFPRANFLSLDVEGGEEKVLQTLSQDLSSFPFDVVMVEADRHDPKKNARVQKMLMDIGLEQRHLPHFTGSRNELYIKPHVRDLRPLPNQSTPLRAALKTPTGKTKAREYLLPIEKSEWITQQFNRNLHLLLDWLVLGLGDSEVQEILP